MTAAPTKTSLLALPDELLEDIVERAVGCYPRRPTALALTCRRLGHLVRARIFRRLEYSDDIQWKSWLLIQQAFQVNPVARSLVSQLEYNRRYREKDESEVDEDQGEAVHFVGDPELPFLFYLFPSVTSFTLRNAKSKQLAALLTGPVSPSDHKLRHLSLYYTGHNDDINRFTLQPGWWNALLRFTGLESLTIATEPGYEDCENVTFDTSTSLPLEGVHELEISTAMFPTDGLPLSALLPNLEVLKVLVFSPKNEAEKFARLVRTAPSSLMELQIVVYFESPSIDDIMTVLADRPTLRHLSLPMGAFEAERALRYLLSSGLRSFTFEGSRPLSDDFLLSSSQARRV